MEAVVKFAVAVILGVAVIFVGLGVKETFERGIGFSWGLFAAALGAAAVALMDYWYLQVLKKRRPPKPS